MSYYIIPKVNKFFYSNPSQSSNEYPSIYMSVSLYKYYSEVRQCIEDDISLIKYEDIIESFHPYNYIYNNVLHYKYSVSKLTSNTKYFYDLLEIFSNISLLDNFHFVSIKVLNLTNNYKDVKDCLELFRQDYTDEVFQSMDELNNQQQQQQQQNHAQLILFETTNTTKKEYYDSLIHILSTIISSQIEDGVCIIKIHEMFDKFVVDSLYLLSSFYKKVYIFKPKTSNNSMFEKYIICKNFQSNNITKELKDFLLEKNNLFQNNTLLNFNIPYYFLCKINEINIILGQQMLESMDLLLTILKNKNKNERFEVMRKMNVLKCISWCEKNKIPHNKFIERNNIFLSNQSGTMKILDENMNTENDSNEFFIQEKEESNKNNECNENNESNENNEYKEYNESNESNESNECSI
jgi:hypothetical protein